VDLRVTPIKYIDFHHTAGNEINTGAIRSYHMTKRGYGDIGYNSVIEKNGTIGKGRDVKWAGAHDLGVAKGESYSMNQMAYAICCIGNLSMNKMPDVQYQALLKETLRIMKLYNIPIDRLKCHRDQYSTECPGFYFPFVKLKNDIEKLLKGGEDVLKIAVLLNSKEDAWAGFDVSTHNGGCGVFVRGLDRSIPQDAFNATQLIVVGGATTGHPNEVLVSGNTKYDTAYEVGRYLK